MPATPGTSARKVIDPSVACQDKDRNLKPSNPVASSTQDPFFGIEAGRSA